MAPKSRRHAGGGARSRSDRTPGEPRHRVLNKGRVSLTRNIAHAVVVKDRDVYFIVGRDGLVPLNGKHGLGLYYHDCRFLDGYEVTIAGEEFEELAAGAARGFMARFELTNPDLRVPGGPLIQKEEIGCTWDRVIDGDHLRLCDVLTIENFTLRRIAFPVVLAFRAAFEDVFQVRGLVVRQTGKRARPAWAGGALRFAYDGADGVRRTLAVTCSPAPTRVRATRATYDLRLEPKSRIRLTVTLQVAESRSRTRAPVTARRVDAERVVRSRREEVEARMAQWTRVETDSGILERLLDRSVRDVLTLRSTYQGQAYLAAGVPWYVALFGRDSLIAALEMLPFNPDLAAQTLRLLARYQGQRVDPWRDEEPGKILHELRVGELAGTNEIPQTPYYGSIDSTPLFLILLGRHACWTGDTALFTELRDHVERALDWIRSSVGRTAHGYLSYESASTKGLSNQGWKDSGDSIVNTSGKLATPPIALVEVQGYVYMAWCAMADLYRRVGDAPRADELTRDAVALRTRFNRDFWVGQGRGFALALQAGGRPAAVVSSNPGQALWTGIVAPERGAAAIARLMAEDMFSGWGIRTLASSERAYNPIGYHVGTVWPHDNALIAAGCRRYGGDAAFMRIYDGITGAAGDFPGGRLPELFCGFPRVDESGPVRYPVACHPQAWAAASVPCMLGEALGLRPEAFDRRLRIVRPLLPRQVRLSLTLRRLRLGQARVDLCFERTPRGGVRVEVVGREGDMAVVVGEGTAAG